METQRKVILKVIHNVTNEYFSCNISSKRQPVVMRGLDVGPCVEKWSLDYLSTVSKQKVTVHVSNVTQLNFVKKNFIYRTLPFDEFVKRLPKTKQDEYFLSQDEKYYMRALGEDARKSVADIRQDFPQLAQDIRFPPFYDPEQFFSSVLRLSSKDLQLWTHYDIMDNMLILVSGRKRVVLFKPDDALYMYLNGDKSEVLDIDNPDLRQYPDFVKATRYECILEAGDVLYIPALWFHNVINLEYGVAVNVFWRHLTTDMYDSKDIYGNKDLVLATRAMQSLERTLKMLEELPDQYKDFYGRRFIRKIQQKILYRNPSLPTGESEQSEPPITTCETKHSSSDADGDHSISE